MVHLTLLHMVISFLPLGARYMAKMSNQCDMNNTPYDAFHMMIHCSYPAYSHLAPIRWLHLQGNRSGPVNLQNRTYMIHGNQSLGNAVLLCSLLHVPHARNSRHSSLWCKPSSLWMLNDLLAIYLVAINLVAIGLRFASDLAAIWNVNNWNWNSGIR